MDSKSKHFVIQKHTRQNDAHWDLMLEHQDYLQTWQIDKAPDKITDNAVKARKIFDHPIRFLTYQGPVNEGKASVQIADTGTYRIIATDKDGLTLDMNGKAMRGEFTLKRIDGDNWQLQRSS